MDHICIGKIYMLQNLVYILDFVLFKLLFYRLPQLILRDFRRVPLTIKSNKFLNFIMNFSNLNLKQFRVNLYIFII